MMVRALVLGSMRFNCCFQLSVKSLHHAIDFWVISVGSDALGPRELGEVLEEFGLELSALIRRDSCRGSKTGYQSGEYSFGNCLCCNV